jgi:hypothetical protein
MEWWQTTVVIAAGLLTVFNLGDKISAWIKEQKQPNKDLESRVEVLERRDLEYKSILAGYEEKLQRDYDSINALKKTMNLMLEAQWVLVDHAKNGNNTKELNDVSEKLKEFVFDK